MVEGAGDADALALAAGKPDAALADAGIEPARQAGDRRVELRDAQRRGHAPLVDVAVDDAERDVAAQRVVEQQDLLRHVADVPAPGAGAGRRGRRRRR